MIKGKKARAEYKPKYKMLVGLLLLASGTYAALFYAAEALSERDYSGIADPQLRVGYCMWSNTSIPEKYSLAESIARPPESEVFIVVLSHALAGEATEQKRTAIRALKERDELRRRAITLSFRVADYCGFGKLTWPPGVTLLDIHTRWLYHDPTYLFFLDRVRAEPDEADRVYYALRGSGARTRGTN